PTASNTPPTTSPQTASRTPTVTRTPTASRTPTMTRTATPSYTPTPTRTKPPTATRWPTQTPTWLKIPVYFADTDLLKTGNPPYESSGVRWARTNSLPETALREYFKGPGSTERYWGYIGIYNGFTGYSKLEMVNNVAHIYLTGQCIGDNSGYTIANLIEKNLKQFDNINFVKIYDQNGVTENPSGNSDSRPACLSAVFVPSPTFTATPTLTRTPTRTPTATRTLRPTKVPTWTKASIYFANKYRLKANSPPYETTGLRWVRTAELPTAILNEYFKGPGSTERYWGYISIYNGFSGYSNLDIVDNVAHVYLTGSCQVSDSDYTIIDLLDANLKQLPEIEFVKVYDADGETAHPQGISDSAPSCLSADEPPLPPTETPTPTETGVSTSVTPAPATFTPTPTPSRTSTPTRTIRPTATREWMKATIYFAHHYRMLWGIQPYEVTGVRWARTAELPRAILNEYFKGPGAYERQSSYVSILDGFTGYSKLELDGNIARVYLLGTCQPEGRPYSLADMLNLNLKQLHAIEYVKIYDANGNTQNPTGASDSVPACLN
ncbi:MAG: hypothetical protein L3J16_00920, partial [Anaerolineales bacterium]|nr:hypothetical protein [Anaerolineales bacterium]